MQRQGEGEGVEVVKGKVFRDALSSITAIRKVRHSLLFAKPKTNGDGEGEVRNAEEEQQLSEEMEIRIATDEH